MVGFPGTGDGSIATSPFSAEDMVRSFALDEGFQSSRKLVIVGTGTLKSNGERELRGIQFRWLFAKGQTVVQKTHAESIHVRLDGNGETVLVHVGLSSRRTVQGFSRPTAGGHAPQNSDHQEPNAGDMLFIEPWSASVLLHGAVPVQASIAPDVIERQRTAVVGWICGFVALSLGPLAKKTQTPRYRCGLGWVCSSPG